MLTRCPKCGHQPLPVDQALPASCPACGVILSKVAGGPLEKGDGAATGKSRRKIPLSGDEYVGSHSEPSQFRSLLLNGMALDPAIFWLCVGLWAAFALWGLNLIVQDYRTGELGSSFIHRPLLIFHEAGHVVFRLFGQWIMVLGGTLGQLIMPAVLGGALLFKNRDPFGASIGLWLLGVSLMDIAPYIYDALHPQLMLLSGTTGEEGGHDWIYLLTSVGLLDKAHSIGGLVHMLGALTVSASTAWGGWVLRLQHERLRQLS